MTSLETGIQSESFESVRSRLTDNYREIEERAKTTILEERTVSNPLFTGEREDERYSVATIGLISGPADAFFDSAKSTIEKVEPGIQWVPDGFRHITLREFNFNPLGRKAAYIDATAVRKYYEALRKRFAQPQKPIRLELMKIIPTIDREQNSVAFVGAFLPKTDTEIIDIRRQMNDAIEETGLSSASRLGEIRVLFSTLGRFPHPPQKHGDNVPFLSTLEEINQKLPKGCDAIINNIDLLSSTPGRYIEVDRHVYLIPPISLIKENPSGETHFVKPAHRKMLDRFQ